MALALGTLGLSGSCSRTDQRSASDQAASGPAVKGPQVQAVGEPSAHTFGAAPALAGDPIDVTQVLAAPNNYLQQTIKCQGTVSRVCEAAGCWLELRADAGGAGLRVPMAGHSFFVPQTIVGKRAVVEGTLSTRQLSNAELAHLRGEGLEASGPLFLAATSVVVSESGARAVPPASTFGQRSQLVPSEHPERARFR
jgi:hypothetical protein